MDSKTQRLPARRQPGFQTARAYLREAAWAFDEIADELDRSPRQAEPDAGEAVVKMSHQFATELAGKLRQCHDLCEAAAALDGALQVGGFPHDARTGRPVPAPLTHKTGR